MKSERKPYAVVVVLLAVMWGGLELSTALARGAEKDREEAAGLRSARAFLALEACFIGVPIEPGETLAERVRAIDAARRDDPATEDGTEKNGWPQRCSRYAAELGDAIGAEEHGSTYLRGVASSFGATLSRGVPDMTALVPYGALTSHFRDADRTSVSADVPRAPKPTRTTPLLERHASHWPDASIWSSGEMHDEEIRLALNGLGFVCRVRTDRADASCLAVPDGAPRGNHGPKILSAPADGPLLVGFGASVGSSVVDVDSGRVVMEDPGYLEHGAVTAGGALLASTVEGDRTSISTRSASGAVSKSAFASAGAIVAGEVLITNGAGDTTEVRAIAADGALGAPVRFAAGAGWRARDRSRGPATRVLVRRVLGDSLRAATVLVGARTGAGGEAGGGRCGPLARAMRRPRRHRGQDGERRRARDRNARRGRRSAAAPVLPVDARPRGGPDPRRGRSHRARQHLRAASDRANRLRRRRAGGRPHLRRGAPGSAPVSTDAIEVHVTDGAAIAEVDSAIRKPLRAVAQRVARCAPRERPGRPLLLVAVLVVGGCARPESPTRPHAASPPPAVSHSLPVAPSTSTIAGDDATPVLDVALSPDGAIVIGPDGAFDTTNPSLEEALEERGVPLTDARRVQRRRPGLLASFVQEAW